MTNCIRSRLLKEFLILRYGAINQFSGTTQLCQVGRTRSNTRGRYLKIRLNRFVGGLGKNSRAKTSAER